MTEHEAKHILRMEPFLLVIIWHWHKAELYPDTFPQEGRTRKLEEAN